MKMFLSVYVVVLCLASYGSAFIVPKLLLPYYEKIQVNHTIHSEEGCYKWSSQNSDVASIEPIPKDSVGCTSSAVVYVQSKSPSRRITLILAENEITGTVLQCDVIVDRISSIDIISRTRELYLDDPPETLNIRALDHEGNTFSSTAFMLFNWKLLPDDEANKTRTSPRILHIGQFIETDYTAEPYVEELERKGLQSDTILLSGVQTGTANVMAQLRTTKETLSAKIPIIVRDKVFLIPNGAVWIPVVGVIQFRVEKWRKGRPTEVKMPHEQYFLQLGESFNDVEDEDVVVTLDTDKSLVIGRHLGQVQLDLMDRNLKTDTIQDSCLIQVVEPAYIRFAIIPEGPWSLETDRKYIILVHVYDAEHHRLFPCNNFRITTTLDPDFFKSLEVVKNETWNHVATLQKGITKIHAKLYGITHENGTFNNYEPVIETSQVVEIFDPIKVRPPVVVFPWQPKPVLYRYKLRAYGGSGNYTWSIDNNTFAIVSSNGMITTKVGPELEIDYPPNSAVVRATDMRNPAHWGSADVLLSPIEEILFARSHREAEIDTNLDLFLTMLAEVKEEIVQVADCRRTGVKYSIQDPSVFRLLEGADIPIPDYNDTIACQGLRLKALKEGHTVVRASYLQILPSGHTELLEASVTVAAFPALQSIDPVSIAVVSLDSTKLIRFRGGPIRWPLWHSGHEKEASSNNSKITTTSLVLGSHLSHQVIARCQTLGYSKVTLKVFNRPCNTNPMPVVASASVRVLCDIPHHLGLSVSSLPPTCPLQRADLVQTVALTSEIFSINVTVFNNIDVLFDNFTSIVVNWKSSVSETTFLSETSIFTPVDSTEQRKHILNQMIKLAPVGGEQVISVSLTKYRGDTSSAVCNMFNCQTLDPIVSDSIGVLVVTPPKVCRDEILLFNHEDFKEDVQIEGGSGYFDTSIEPDSRTVAIINRSPAEITLAPVSVGSARLKVIDLCLAPKAIAYTDVIVIEVGKIILRGPPRLALDGTATVTIEVEDNLGKPIPADLFPYLDLELESSVPEILVVGQVYLDPSYETVMAVANISAANVGTTMLTATSQMRNDRVLQSNAIHLVVISLLELYPSQITLIKHSEYQLRTVGGPRSDFTMKFEVDDGQNNPVVNVSQSGVVHALRVGETRVSAYAVMHDGTVFHCRKPTNIRVIQLMGVRIDSPLTQFHVGGTVPLHVNGLSDNENPMSFGSSMPGLIFDWKSANPSVIKLHTVHANAGINTGPELSFTMLAEGMSPGHCVIRVTVTAVDENYSLLTQEKLTAEISLMVYDPLAIVGTDSSSWKQWRSTNNFLITPSTCHHLETNRDGIAKSIYYQVLTDRNCFDDDIKPVSCVSISKKGFITSGPNQCQATVLVTSVERFGVNQTLALHVLVRPVSFVIARAVTKFRSRANLLTSYAFPLGSTVKFVVDQFDEAADRFDATGHDVILELNRYDKVEIQPESGNRSFTLRLPLEGTTIMSVESYLKSTTIPSAIYYFPVNVLPVLKPQQQTLTIGLRFCFLTEFININGTDGSWHSSSPNFLVSSETGSVLAVAPGEDEITYAVDNLQSTALVSTRPFLASLHDGKLTGPILSKTTSYSLPIYLHPDCYAEKCMKCVGLDKEMDELAKTMFSCSVHFSNSSSLDEMYSAEARYCSKRGGYVCLITRKDVSEDERRELAAVDDYLIISLSALSQSLGSVDGGVAKLQFYPSFYAYLSSNTLAPGSFVQLCISAPVKIFKTIKIVPCDGNLLTITEHKIDSFGAYCYKVMPNNREVTARSAYFRVISHLTEQEERFDLIIDRVAGRLASSSSPCSSADRTMWKGASDMLSDTYLAYLSSLSVIIISAALLMAAFTAYRWVASNSARPSSSFQSPPPPYNLNSSGLSPPRGPGSPGSSPKVRLWSRYYQPQQASPSTG